MPTTGGHGISPEGSGANPFSVSKEHGIHVVNEVSPPSKTRRSFSPTSRTNAIPEHRAPFDTTTFVGMAKSKRVRLSATNPAQIKSSEQGLNLSSVSIEHQEQSTQEVRAKASDEAQPLGGMIEQRIDGIKVSRPVRDLTSQAEWKQWLKSNIEGLRGNLDNAAMLMAALNEGKNYIYEKLTNRGVTSFVKPHTFIHFSLFRAPVYENIKLKGVMVSKYTLEQLSNSDIHEIITFTTKDGIMMYQGTLLDLQRLNGVEETHHSAFEQIKGVIQGSNPSEYAAYHAQEHEYRALIWEVRYAEERVRQGLMPEVTLHVLKDRLAAAKTVRAKKQK